MPVRYHSLTSLSPSKHSHVTPMSSSSAHRVCSFVQAEKLGGRSSFSTSSGPASHQVFLCWPPASFAALQPILSSPSLEFEPRHGTAFKDFTLVSAAFCPLPHAVRPLYICPASSLFSLGVAAPWSHSWGMWESLVITVMSSHCQQSMGRARDGNCPAWERLQLMEMFYPELQGRTMACCCLCPLSDTPSGLCTKNSYVFEFQPRPARCL